MNTPEPKIEPRPDLGVVFDVRRFERPGRDGVSEGFQPTGPWDFPQGGYEHSIEHGNQKVRIKPGAPTNGDAGLERHFAVTPGDVYRLSARLRVTHRTGAFKGRVNLSARGDTGKQIEEFNDTQEDVTDTPLERTAIGVVPPETSFLTVRVKFHTAAPGDAGEGEIYAMRLERIKEVPKSPPGPRVSLYNFNIHKMDDDWRGWIRFIKDQGLAEPDIVLLQDVESDPERTHLGNVFGEAFGGSWASRGTDPEWQTAIMWRSGRFSFVDSRVWHGFGGGACLDGSQDAPAIQVKLHDDVAGKSVSLVSLKTPPSVPDDCVWKNMKKVDDNFEPPWGGDLCVIGTDANSPDWHAADWARWYRRTVRSEAGRLEADDTLGFCDPVLDVCGHDRARMEEHLTLGPTRVDFLLMRTGGRKAPHVVRQMTLPRGNAHGVKWSDHRSVHAEIAY